MASTRLGERAASVADRVPLGGPITEFEEVGRLQLEVLVHEGLYPDSKVLDVGCGALRGGYWLMHFLDPGCYFGIEPFREMLEAGLHSVVEPSLVEEKRPTFSDTKDFEFSAFGVKFDFVLARSIWTHASMEQIALMLDRFVEVAAPGATMVTSYFRFPPPLRDSPRFFGSILLSQRDLLYARLPQLREKFGRRLGTRLAGYARPMPEDATGEHLPGKMIAHTFARVQQACAARGLVARELGYGVVNNQRWLVINERVGGA